MARILVVEDNLDLLNILRELLSQEHEVRTARDGDEGVAIAVEFRPEVVILDLQLPTMDGIEAGLWIKRRLAPENVAILALTALAGADDRDVVLRSGCCDEYMAKPATLDNIRAKVNELLTARPYAA